MPPLQTRSMPQEDLSVVMGRFQAWDAVQKGLPQLGATDGVREITLEEALAARQSAYPVRQPLSDERPKTEGTLSSDPVATSRNTREWTAEPGAPFKADIFHAGQGNGYDHELSPAAPAAKPPAQRKRRAAAITGPSRASEQKRRKASASATAAIALEATMAQAQKGLKKQGLAGTRPVIHQRAAKPERPGTLLDAASFRSVLSESVDLRPSGKPVTRMQPASPQTARAFETRSRKPSTSMELQCEPIYSQGKSAGKLGKPARCISVNLRLSKPEHARMRSGAAAASSSLAQFIRESTLRALTLGEQEKRRLEVQKTLRHTAHVPRPSTENTLQADEGDRSAVELGKTGLLTRMRAFWFAKRFEAKA